MDLHQENLKHVSRILKLYELEEKANESQGTYFSCYWKRNSLGADRTRDLGVDAMSSRHLLTEAERLARLHKRAGCDCEERAMTDPTPEERAYELGLATYTGLADEAKIAAAIRAAVEAEREACAKACEEIGKEIVCPEECAAAIRARGEKG
jgi:hypothetical protein